MAGQGVKVTGGPGWRLAMAGREPDQARRLAAFRRAHPEVQMGPGEFGTCQAWIPAGNGHEYDGHYVYGHTLRELLDNLSGVLKAASGDPGTAGDPPSGGAGPDPGARAAPG